HFDRCAQLLCRRAIYKQDALIFALIFVERGPLRFDSFSEGFDFDLKLLKVTVSFRRPGSERDGLCWFGLVQILLHIIEPLLADRPFLYSLTRGAVEYGPRSRDVGD